MFSITLLIFINVSFSRLFDLDERETEIFPKVDADAKIKNDKNIDHNLEETLKEKSEDETESESEDEDSNDEKKKKKKEKVGFRDRKVCLVSSIK